MTDLQETFTQAMMVVIPAVAALVVAWVRAKTRKLDEEAARVVALAEKRGELMGLNGAGKLRLAMSAAQSPLSDEPPPKIRQRIERAVKRL